MRKYILLLTASFLLTSCALYNAAFRKELSKQDSINEYVFDFARKTRSCLIDNVTRKDSDLQFELVLKFTEDKNSIEKALLKSSGIKSDLLEKCRSFGVKYLEDLFELFPGRIHSREGGTQYQIDGKIMPDFEWQVLNQRTNIKWKYKN